MAATAIVNDQSTIVKLLIPFGMKHAFRVDTPIGVGTEVIALGLR
jgi:hypothetical protein